MTDTIKISRELRPVLSMILNALDRDAEEGKAARGEMAAELRSLLAQPLEHPGTGDRVPSSRQKLACAFSLYPVAARAALSSASKEKK